MLNKLGGGSAGGWSANGKAAGIQHVNVRTINGLDLGKLKIKKVNGKSGWGEPYVLDGASLMCWMLRARLEIKSLCWREARWE